VQPTAPGTSAGANNRTSTSTTDKIKEMGQVEVDIERGGFETSMPMVSEKTTIVQSAQFDEIKRSIPKLAGLAALENYGNQIMMTRGYNTGAPLNNTFSSLLEQRVADLKRWEEAATKSGVATTLEKQGERRTKVEGSKDRLKVTRSGELGSKTTFSTSTNVNAGGGGEDGGVYEYEGASGQKQTVEADPKGNLTRTAADIGFKIGPRELKDGPTFFNRLKQTVAAQTLPDLKGWKLEADNPTNPGTIKITDPSGSQQLEWQYDNSQARWRLSATTGTNVSALQLYTGNSYVRRGSKS
jgi:hypothetical protein